jgi:chitodextrinase
MSSKYLRELLFLLLISLSTKAQVSITFPMEKAVFQRNNSNQANLYIGGTFSVSLTSVEARLLNPLAGNAVVINWTTIQNSPTGGTFFGSLNNVNGGWYTLEVRGKDGNTVVGTSTLNRVGVGEVFIIAGQSNAQGLSNAGSVDGGERVLSHNNLSTVSMGGACLSTFPPYPDNSQLLSNNYLSKTGLSAWSYGRLGDLLVGRLGVPVAFYNGSHTASTIRNWKESSDGLPTTSIYSGQTYCAAAGFPYAFFKRTLNYYASMFGVRAVLWHQGESDGDFSNQEYGGQRPNAAQYQANLEYVINKSRQDLGNNSLAWVVSRVSYFNGATYQPVIDGQNNTITSGTNIFAGPQTDWIVNSPPNFNKRSDAVHFHNDGLIDVANEWNNSLSNSFFSSSTPVSAKTPPQITISSNCSGVKTLSAPAGYSFYKWVRTSIGNNDFESPAEETTQSIVRTSGSYRCYVTDAQGNVIVSQTVDAGINVSNSKVFLSNLTEASATNGFGPIEKDRSNGGSGANDGQTLTLNGVTYTKGLGIHANSTIIYNLNNEYGLFLADIGMDDEISDGPCGSVRFEVYKDNVLAYQSPIMNPNSATIPISINLTGTNQLKLVVTDAGDNNFCDHANWAGARVFCNDTQAPTSPTSLALSNVVPKCATLTWGASTDNTELLKYNIYQNNVLIGFVASNVTTYNLTNLQLGQAYTFTVKAEDIFGNLSNAANVTLTQPSILVTYPSCNSGTAVPTAINMTGGTFTMMTAGATVNPTTGVINAGSIGVYQVKYKVGSGTCADSTTVNVTFNNPPNPIASTNKTFINIGQSATLTVSNCSGTILWSTGQSTSTINVSPTSLANYTVNCNVSGCSGGSNVTVFVIPNCTGGYVLNNVYNVFGLSNDLTFAVSNTIVATNQIGTQAKVNYYAGKAVTLSPGFVADSGTVFKAQIQGCN